MQVTIYYYVLRRSSIPGKVYRFVDERGIGWSQASEEVARRLTPDEIAAFLLAERLEGEG